MVAALGYIIQVQLSILDEKVKSLCRIMVAVLGYIIQVQLSILDEKVKCRSDNGWSRLYNPG